MHIPMMTNRYRNGSIGVVHSTVCGSSKFTGTKSALKGGSGFAQV